MVTKKVIKEPKTKKAAKVLSAKDQWMVDNINKQLESQTNAEEIKRLNAQKETLLS